MASKDRSASPWITTVLIGALLPLSCAFASEANTAADADTTALPPLAPAAPAAPAAQAAEAAEAAQPATVQHPAAEPVAPKPATEAKPARPGAGSFEVDEDAAQRALERTLTQAGALLLAPGTYEISPALQYVRTEQTSSTLVSLLNPQTGTPVASLAENKLRKNDFTLRVDLRAGLPYATQLELSLPFIKSSVKERTPFGTENTFDGNGLGDITLGLAKTLMREKGWQPDLIGRLNFNTGSGKKIDSPLPSGTGYRQLQAELLAVKRQDPLAFVASATYIKVFEKDNLKPGDAFTASLAAVLAASPATSLQLGFAQVYRRKQENQGVRIAGSDQTYGTFNLGASSVLSRDTTLVTQFGIGVGSDAPKYTITVALPIIFR